ncbi:MAG: FtsX-like permease family protein [Candidatus Margulisiibacteriota bacterium]|jgi:ABC-type lipoprotein release transport system permease subunit
MYKHIIKIAFLNLFRRKSRTISVIIMIAFGVSMLMFTQGLYEGMVKQMIDDSIRTGAGQIEICKKGFYESQLLSDYMANPHKIEKVLNSQKNISAYTYRLKADGLVSSSQYSQGVKVIGINAKKEQRFINYKNSVLKGSFNLVDRKVIIGYRLADKLKVKVGKKIVVNGQAKDKELVASVFRVVGIIRTNNPEIDEAAVLINLPEMQQLFKVAGVSEFNLILKSEKLLPETISDLRLRLTSNSQPLDVISWEKIYTLLVMMESMMDYFIYISYFIVFMAVAVGLFNIMLISVLERIREFGILIALGTSFKLVRAMILFEALFLGFIGFLAGSTVGFFLLLYCNIYGLNLSIFSEGLNSIGMAAIMYTDIKPGYFVLAFVAVFITAICSVIMPILKLRKLKPVEAIRFV